MFKLSWLNFAILSKVKVMQIPMHCVYTSYLFFSPHSRNDPICSIYSAKLWAFFLKILELTQNVYKYKKITLKARQY